VRPPLEIRIDELVVVGLEVDSTELGPAVETALAARLEAGPPSALETIDASSLGSLADGVAARLHEAIAERIP
jgi:hypothetical protein